MSAANDDALTTCDEQVDIKPDIGVLCHDTSTTNADSVDIKPEITYDNTSTTSILQSFVCETNVGHIVEMSASYNDALTSCNELVDIKPDFSVLCHDISTTNADCVVIKSEITFDITPLTTS